MTLKTCTKRRLLPTHYEFEKDKFIIPPSTFLNSVLEVAKDLRSQVDNARVKCIDIDRVQRTSMGYISNEINPQFCFLHYWLSSKILQATIIVLHKANFLCKCKHYLFPERLRWLCVIRMIVLNFANLDTSCKMGAQHIRNKGRSPSTSQCFVRLPRNIIMFASTNPL